MNINDIINLFNNMNSSRNVVYLVNKDGYIVYYGKIKDISFILVNTEIKVTGFSSEYLMDDDDLISGFFIHVEV